MGKGAGFVTFLLVLIGGLSLAAIVGLVAYSRMVSQEPAVDPNKEMMMNAKASELEARNSDLESRLAESSKRLAELKSLNSRLQEATEQFNSEKEVILSQVKDSVKGFLEYKEESAEEIQKLKSQIAALEGEKDGLSQQYSELAEESEATNTLLTSQIHELNQIIDRHKRKIAFYRDLTERRESHEVVAEVAKLHYNLGNFYFKNAEYKEAADEYQKSLLYSPNDPDTHFNLAVVYDERLGFRAKAVKHYKTYMALNPTDENILDIENRILDLELQLETLSGNSLAAPSMDS